MALGCTDCPPPEIQWKKGNNAWQKLPAATSIVDANASEGQDDIVLIFAQADRIRECLRCNECYSKCFGIPRLWWTNYSRSSNGYFGCESTFDEQGARISYNTWLRVLVKQILKSNCGIQTPYQWYKFNILTQWLPKANRTCILVFDPPLTIREQLLVLLPEKVDDARMSDPFWLYNPLFEEVVRLQDDAVWSVRDLVRTTERKRISPRNPAPNYPYLHDLARHAIHVVETLDLATKTMDTILKQHTHFIANTPCQSQQAKAVSTRIHERLSFYDHMLSSLRSRAASNKERLLNEIGLAFNTVAQFDSRVGVQIGRAAQSDGAAMKTIAFVTLTFLPGTFLTSLFSMSFFNYNAESHTWSMSEKMWIYWVIAIPLTILTTLLWYGWRAFCLPLSSIGRLQEQQSRGKDYWDGPASSSSAVRYAV